MWRSRRRPGLRRNQRRNKQQHAARTARGAGHRPRRNQASRKTLRNLLHRSHAHKEALLAQAEADAGDAQPRASMPVTVPAPRVVACLIRSPTRESNGLSAAGGGSHAIRVTLRTPANVCAEAPRPEPKAPVSVSPHGSRPSGSGNGRRTRPVIGPVGPLTRRIRRRMRAFAPPARGPLAHVEELGRGCRRGYGRHLLGRSPGTAHGARLKGVQRVRAHAIAMQLQPSRRRGCAGAGEGAVLHASDKELTRNSRPFAVCTVARGNLPAALALLRAPGLEVGHGGDTLSHEGFTRASATKAPATECSFRQVFHARGILPGPRCGAAPPE